MCLIFSEVQPGFWYNQQKLVGWSKGSVQGLLRRGEVRQSYKLGKIHWSSILKISRESQVIQNWLLRQLSVVLCSNLVLVEGGGVLFLSRDRGSLSQLIERWRNVIPGRKLSSKSMTLNIHSQLKWNGFDKSILMSECQYLNLMENLCRDLKIAVDRCSTSKLSKRKKKVVKIFKRGNEIL